MEKTEIKEVISRKELMSFLRLPWKIYSHDRFWVPPLLSEQRRILNRKLNPFFKHALYKAWVSFLPSGVVGRILAYIDSNHNKHYREKTGFVGFFECVDDQETANQLFNVALQWLREQGMEKMCGPMNFSIGNECGVQLHGFNTSPYIQMSHTPHYYNALFEKAGFTKAHDLYAYKLVGNEVKKHELFPRLKMITDNKLQQKELIFRPINMNRYKSELELINTIFNQTLQYDWGFVPSAMEEVLFTADAMKMIVDPELIIFAEHKGRVVGCSISLPDINQVLIHLNGKLFPFGWIRFLYYKQKINRIRVYLLGILEENRCKGLDVVFYYQSIMKAMERGYNEAELSWISEDNTAMIRIVEKIGATRYKSYRMFQKVIR